VSDIIKTPEAVEDADGVIAKVLESIMKQGEVVSDKKSRQGDFIEIRNLQFALTNPHKRITTNPKRPMDLVSAIARFVWMIAGSDRLEDIAFYQEKVREYSDNGLSVPGSSYGKRLFEPQPGIDQIKACIEVLKDNPSSRRACAAIWQPIDATRILSKDLPCAFGINFEIRKEKLYSTLVMRSNNAITLLHMNLFEFTLLGEMVAKELGIEYGGHVQDVFSMHIFQTDKKKAVDILNAFEKMEPYEKLYVMPKMPMDPSPFEEARKLALLETTLRNHNVFHELTNLDDHLKNAKNILHPYWFEFYKVLAIGVLIRLSKFDEAQDLTYSLKPYFKLPMISQLDKLKNAFLKKSNSTLDMFVDEENSKFEKLQKIFSVSDEKKNNLEKKVTAILNQWNNTHIKKLTKLEEEKILNEITERFVIAARSEQRPMDPSKNSEDYLEISKKEVFDMIKDIIKTR